MILLITGGSGSGKSAYAEACITALSEKQKKYYIATMQVFDEEGQVRIERHRNMRSGKNFFTIEQPISIEEAIHKMDSLSISESAALVECMSNLVANEMFLAEEVKPCEVVAEKILHGVEQLTKELKHLVIVTNNVFEDGVTYDKTTMEYLRAMGSINEKLAVMADQVVEVVVGIPVIVKEGK